MRIVVDLNQKKIVWIGIVAIIIYGIFFWILPYWPSYAKYHLPLAREDYDTEVYWRGVQWWKNGDLPYQGLVFNTESLKKFASHSGVPYVAETYPQLGLLYLTVPSLLAQNFTNYQYALFIWNGVWFLILIIGAGKILKLLNLKWQRAAWLCLPAFLFFTFSRYDIFASALVIWSLFYLLRHKFTRGFALLSAGVIAKVYPVLLVPLYLIYAHQHKYSLTKALSVLAIVIGGTILTFAWWTGLAETLAPYFIHLTRGGNKWSLLYWLEAFWPYPYVVISLRILFKILQIGLPIWLTTRFFLHRTGIISLTIDNKKLINLGAITLLLNIIFNSFYSPQWIIWFIPWLILALNYNRMWLIMVHDLLTFLSYPLIPVVSVLIYFSNLTTTKMTLLLWSNTLFYLIIIWHLLILLYLTWWLVKYPKLNLKRPPQEELL